MIHQLTEDEKKTLQQLSEKYNQVANELQANLEGLLHSKGVNYWEYIQLDSLLTLQHTKTDYDDEVIFIVYHQITELYFKLISQELEILTDCHQKEYLIRNNWMKRLGRVINYYRKLTDSWDIMLPGNFGKPDQFFSSDEFVKFRTSLMPASGFQSVSFRKLEIMSTGIFNLIHSSQRSDFLPNDSLEKLYQYLYWKTGGRIKDSDDGNGNLQKTKTLAAFEKKYDKLLLDFSKSFEKNNLEYLFFKFQPEEESDKQKMIEIRDDISIRELLVAYDEMVNITWKTKHLETIRQQMPRKSHGTGGTNWREFLPPEIQQISYFPALK